MSKSVKIQDSPEFKEFKENFEATMDVMEKDPEFAQMKLPEEWERDFKETMEATWEEERQKKKKRIGKRIAIAAGVTLVTLAGLNLGVQQVQGEGLVEFFQRTFNLNGKQYTTFDVGEEFAMNKDENVEEMHFDASNIEELNELVRQELKKPIFYVHYIPEEFELIDAIYYPAYDIVNYNFMYNSDVIYISQNQQYNEITSGNMNEELECDSVDNKKINQTIKIYQSINEQGFSFKVEMDHSYLIVNSMSTLEVCKKIAESIDYH